MFITWLICLVVYNIMWGKEYQIPPILWMSLIPMLVQDAREFLRRSARNLPTEEITAEDDNTLVRGKIVSMDGSPIPEEVKQAARKFAQQQLAAYQKEREEKERKDNAHLN